MQYYECSSWSGVGVPAAVNAAIKLAVPTMLLREANPPPPLPLAPLLAKTAQPAPPGATGAKPIDTSSIRICL